MKKNIFDKVFITGFMLILVVPLLFMNREDDVFFEHENRPLAGRPHIFVNSQLNSNLPTQIEDYLNDRIGFRDEFITANALVQYNVFNRMEDGKNRQYKLGPNGEFNIIEGDVIQTYQHFNLFSESELEKMGTNFQEMSDYLKERDCELYYVQCWDKQTIYPEYFPNSIYQYGDQSRTDQFVNYLQDNTSVNVIPLKDVLVSNKDKYEVYSKYGDPVHWTLRGAYIGYAEIMKEINRQNGGLFSILGEKDFDITITDQGMEFYDGVRRINMSENLTLKRTNAVLTENDEDECASYSGNRVYHYKNNAAGNDKRVMIICNSYFINYIRDYFGESFGDTLVIWADISDDYKAWVEEYDPDIVIFEMVERYQTYDYFLR